MKENLPEINGDKQRWRMKDGLPLRGAKLG
jgi:hypothetical protein